MLKDILFGKKCEVCGVLRIDPHVCMETKPIMQNIFPKWEDELKVRFKIWQERRYGYKAIQSETKYFIKSRIIQELTNPKRYNK